MGRQAVSGGRQELGFAAWQICSAQEGWGHPVRGAVYFAQQNCYFVFCFSINLPQPLERLVPASHALVISSPGTQGNFASAGTSGTAKSYYCSDLLSNNCLYCKPSGKFQTSSQNTSETNKLGSIWKQHSFMGVCQGDTGLQINLQSESIDSSPFTPGMELAQCLS